MYLKVTTSWEIPWLVELGPTVFIFSSLKFQYWKIEHRKMIWQDDLIDIWLMAFKNTKGFFLKQLNCEYRACNSDSYVRSK